MDTRESLLITRTSKSWLSNSEKILILECANSGEIIFKEFGEEGTSNQLAQDLFPDLWSALHSASENFSDFFNLTPFFTYEFTLKFGSSVSEESRVEIQRRFKFLLSAPISEPDLASLDSSELDNLTPKLAGSLEQKDRWRAIRDRELFIDGREALLLKAVEHIYVEDAEGLSETFSRPIFFINSSSVEIRVARTAEGFAFGYYQYEDTRVYFVNYGTIALDLADFFLYDIPGLDERYSLYQDSIVDFLELVKVFVKRGRSKFTFQLENCEVSLDFPKSEFEMFRYCLGFSVAKRNLLDAGVERVIARSFDRSEEIAFKRGEDYSRNIWSVRKRSAHTPSSFEAPTYHDDVFHLILTSFGHNLNSCVALVSDPKVRNLISKRFGNFTFPNSTWNSNGWDLELNDWHFRA
jgi:hypothetical protein